ncbi:MAG: GNAT family N-acetyltransferase [Thermoprotei archaeon]
MSSHSEFELNEVEWWSHWVNLEWVGRDVYLLYSNEFREPLFNHAGLLSPSVDLKPSVVLRIEEFYAELEVPPSFIIDSNAEYSEANRTLASAGYTKTDSLTVMWLDKPLNRVNSSVRVLTVDKALTDIWSEVYVSAFGEDPTLMGIVKRIVNSLIGIGGVELLLGVMGDSPCGVTALFTSGGYTGAYCVGTLRERRRMGVAATLLSYAARRAESFNTKLILQTFASDNAEDFYTRLGFRKAYTKNVWVKRV